MRMSLLLTAAALAAVACDNATIDPPAPITPTPKPSTPPGTEGLTEVKRQPQSWNGILDNHFICHWAPDGTFLGCFDFVPPNRVFAGCESTITQGAAVITVETKKLTDEPGPSMDWVTWKVISPTFPAGPPTIQYWRNGRLIAYGSDTNASWVYAGKLNEINATMKVFNHSEEMLKLMMQGTEVCGVKSIVMIPSGQNRTIADLTWLGCGWCRGVEGANVAGVATLGFLVGGAAGGIGGAVVGWALAKTLIGNECNRVCALDGCRSKWGSCLSSARDTFPAETVALTDAEKECDDMFRICHLGQGGSWPHEGGPIIPPTR